MADLKIDSPKEVRSGEELNQALLNDYLQAQDTAFPTIVEIAQFPGGYSNLTYLLKTAQGAEFVLRRPPFGAKNIKGGHDMGREFKVLKAVKEAGYHKVPTPIAYCEDESVMGCPFYVMERVQGVILRSSNALKLNLDSSQFKAASEALVDNMVALHALDINSPGLAQLGKPEGYIRRQVDGWYKRYQAAQTDDISGMEQLYQWLDQQMPTENTPTLIHNDYKYDNVVLNPANLADIKAVLDWEMCTIGDPMMDLGTSLSYWAEANDGAFEKSFNLTWLPGNLTRKEFATRYGEKSGRDVSTILYYYVFGLFKNAVVIQQIYGRYKKGLTQDPRFAQLIIGVHALVNTGVKAVERNTI
ncbi:MAG: phosphotransferase family protein [Spirosomataceae bacterium]